ncbi:GntR family transcriptional regulator [Kitasatospora sp. NBC_01250]|uniref:GntR family transcriptional regulator n=1 Tax=unclassified Kitasatospora TaxID=2633591 RepID=UPI002E105445|nr:MULTISPECIES: GntR family transcriptional regulator [unclassified Kitasatospora]WSJ69163.1 GntR family transcriptional regulator [Kitasatospora sp. NBC_01302]
MTISSGSVPSPKYQRLAADLRRRIAAGEWRGDTALPVESELEQQYGVARNTVRLAVDVLVNEGRLVRLQGKGTFLREHPVLDHWAFGPPLTASPVDAVAHQAVGPAAELLSPGRAGPAPAVPAQRNGLASPSAVYSVEADAAGRSLTAEFEMLIVRARVDIAERLGLRPGEAVVVRRQLRLMDREPYSIEESHYRAGVAAGTALMEPDPVPGGDEAVLAALGRSEIGAVDQLVSRMPGPEEAQWFQGGPGVPLLVQTRVTYDRRGPVRVIETRYSADRCRLVYGLGELAARPVG